MENYILFNQNTFRIELQIMDDIVDYYSNICIRLIGENNIYEILNDNIYFLKNIKEMYSVDIEKYEIDARILEQKLGVLQNEYYYCLNENISNKDIIMDENDEWIGEKYCCFTTSEYSTWLYKKGGKFYLMVTPMFRYFDEENNRELYLEFINEYRNIFFSEILLEQLEKICDIIEKIYQQAVTPQ
ncbi:hypothetical protein [Candidatus Galacturonibacter soehngenii]|uniref:Uncharacterized protein n=1 Tax=Candidatus Galacturonatibacter soehngenii TaxID=2307010 RepID=A0A7V7QKR7_9FIRM|nr:hypothetical protein [Candidatus Galacturonibacter soehngenii]KAB1438061.1 hypothetical protein F7O84_10875 [Candidatus Galacturonibacter soehngenii]